MGEITIHFQDELELAFEGPEKPGAIGAAEPCFGGAMEHLDGGVSTGELVSQLAGAIR